LVESARYRSLKSYGGTKGSIVLGTNPDREHDMAGVEQNKEVSRRWIEVFNQRDDAAEADVRAPDFVAHAPASLEPDALTSQPWVEFLAGFVEGFPDLRLTVESAVGEGDLVAQKIHFEGTHTGVFQGLPPTGKNVAFEGLELNRHDDDGRVVEHWFQLDALGLLQQLGLIVIPGPRLLPRIVASLPGKLRKKR
jgi:predicted ester cyclase